MRVNRKDVRGVRAPFERLRLRGSTRASRTILALAVVLAAPACHRNAAGDRWSAAEAQPVAYETDVLCDSSSGSPCNATRFGAAFDAELERADSAPGSVVRAWVLGRSAADTTLIAEVTSVAPNRPGKQAAASHHARFMAEGHETFQRAASAYFAAHEPARQSPIAEGITRVARYGHDAKRPRRIVALSDLRIYGGVLRLDLECGPIPTSDRFLALLHQNQLLAPGSLRGVSVTCAFVDLPPAGRCTTSLANQAELEALWLAALTSAGADARITAGPPDHDAPTSPARR